VEKVYGTSSKELRIEKGLRYSNKELRVELMD